jgi:hypothetical protein
MFAVLEHHESPASSASPAALSDQPAVHWDLLVELPGQERLATWRLCKNPIETDVPIPAVRIQDHRRIYLEFEGPLTGDRGSVCRIDRGEAQLRSLPAAANCATSDAQFALELHGQHLQGTFVIMRFGPELCFARASHP